MRVLRVGVDATDREINEALYGNAPPGYDFLVIGHESFGIVEEIGPNDDPADEDIDLDDDADLPVPDPVAVESWWRENGGLISRAGPVFLGQQAAKEVYEQAFQSAKQRQRRVAAMAFALTPPEEKLPNWRVRAR